MNMEDDNITGNQVLELIKDKRKSFHSKARFPNALLIHPGYYSVLKEVLPAENRIEQLEGQRLVVRGPVAELLLEPDACASRGVGFRDCHLAGTLQSVDEPVGLDKAADPLLFRRGPELVVLGNPLSAPLQPIMDRIAMAIA